jgi:hypothetical protein
MIFFGHHCREYPNPTSQDHAPAAAIIVSTTPNYPGKFDAALIRGAIERVVAAPIHDCGWQPNIKKNFGPPLNGQSITSMGWWIRCRRRLKLVAAGSPPIPAYGHCSPRRSTCKKS